MATAHRALFVTAAAVIGLAVGVSFFLPAFDTGMAPVLGYEAFLAGVRAWRELPVAPSRVGTIIALSWLSNLLVPVGLWGSLRARLPGRRLLFPGALLAWLPLLLGPGNLLVGFYLWSGGLSALAVLAVLAFGMSGSAKQGAAAD